MPACIPDTENASPVTPRWHLTAVWTRCVVCAICLLSATETLHSQTAEDSLKFEYFPFALYDTDVGFGAGANAVLRSALGSRERFELMLFASSKGERLLRLDFSMEAEELRQGTEYDFAVDLRFEYDKMIQTSFFGTGSGSRYEDKESYVHEPVLLQAVFSRGFTPTLVAQLQMKFKRMWSYGFEETSRLRDRADNATTSDLSSLALRVRHDTRDNTLHTSAGHVLQGEVEQALSLTRHGSVWTRLGVTAHWYRMLAGMVFATRGMLQHITGDAVPVQQMLAVGGNRTLRGQPENRFLDRASAVGNAELRIPLYRRLGLLLGVDAGAVSATLPGVLDARWSAAPVIGLRFAFDTFIVRGDVGRSSDAVGVYFNVGQVF
ncbi:MAG: BamA/TamA family outer membrane protein [Bacteroidia bacterium]|nr:BamA/TamA family outer membrane protein [Bacteroidia bacterium]